MYWKTPKASQRLRLKAGEPCQTVAVVYPDRWGYTAEGYARKQTVWSVKSVHGLEHAKRMAEAWARRNGFA